MDRTIGRLVYKIVGDDKQFEKSLAKSYRALEKTGKQMQQLGAKLTLGLTVPIAAGSAAMLKAAIDAEETRAKFETAFAGITDAADEVRDNLADNYGLARDEAERLLSSTGDLLKGFGATTTQALGLSDQVQQLSVDLASYNNLQGGASRASEILTKAMLGEREALTSLGIKISEAEVQQRLLEKGQQDLTGRALLLARAQATLELAYQQSGDALGDFARTQDSAANQIRILRAEIRDLSVELGRELLPMAREILQWALDSVRAFSALSEEQKRTILVIGGLTAALGPLTTAVGTAMRAMGGLRKAMLFLGPQGLAVGAIAIVGGLTAAFWKMSEPLTDADQKAEMFAESLRQAATQGYDLDEVMAEIAKRGDVTVQELRQIAIEQGLATDEMREQYRVQKEQSDEHELHLAMHRMKAEALNEQLETEEAITDELEERARKTNYQEYWEAVNDRWRELGQNLSIYQNNLEQIRELDDKDRQIEELERLERMLELDIGMVEQEQKFPVTAEARLELLGQIQALMGSITGEAETQSEAVLTQRDRFNMLRAELEETNLEMEYLSEWQRTLIDDAQDVNDAMLSSVGALQQGWALAFQALGEGLKTGTLQAKDLKNALTGAVAAVIKALAEEYAIRAAAALIPGPTFNPAAAAGYAAVSGAAYAAAGFVSAFGSGGDFAVQEPTLVLAGESGPEEVSIRPVDNVSPPGSFGGEVINIYGDVYGYNDFAERMEEANGRAVRLNRVKPR